MATTIYLTIDGVQGDSEVPEHIGSFTVSTFEMRGPTGGWEPGGGVSPDEMRGPTGGVTIASGAGQLVVTIPGGQSLAPLSAAFTGKRKFSAGSLTVDQPSVVPIVFYFKELLVVGISGIADEDGAEYQVTFSYASVSIT